MPRVRNEFGADATLSSTLPLEGVDIGPRPDFWADLDAISRRMQPQPQQQAPGPRMQARALRSSGGGGEGSSERPVRMSSGSDYEPIFGTLTYPYGSAGFYQPYMPGMNLGTGQQPFAMGYQRRGQGER